MRKLTIAFLGLLCASCSGPDKPAATAAAPSYGDCADKLSLWNPLGIVKAGACLGDMRAKPTPIAAPAPSAE